MRLPSAILRSGFFRAASLVALLASASSGKPVDTARQNSPSTSPIPHARKRHVSATVARRASGDIAASTPVRENVENSPPLDPLTNGGISEQPHSVDLSWNPSTSSDVVGYNVYRGVTSGGPYSKINSDLDPDSTYTDDSVSGGQTYYYVATAVDSSNQESGPSNEVQAIVPPNQ